MRVLRPTLLAFALLLIGIITTFAAPSVQQEGTDVVEPVAIRISRALVHTKVEARSIEAGTPQEPTGTWVVSWHQETGGLGVPGNVVMYGLLEWWGGVGPTVFWRLDHVRSGHTIDLTGDDGNRYRYRVTSVETYDRATAPGRSALPTVAEHGTSVTAQE